MPDDLSEDDLAELDRLNREATPPPWCHVGQTLFYAISAPGGAHSYIPSLADAKLVAHARNWLGELVAEVRRLREELNASRLVADARRLKRVVASCGCPCHEGGFMCRRADVEKLQAENGRLRVALEQQNYHVEQTLGPILYGVGEDGLPRWGEHTGGTLAVEAVRTIILLQADLAAKDDVIRSLADRCAGQSEALSRRAETP